jgi:hypothetical protein
VYASRSPWTPPPEQSTQPDQLPPDAWRAVELIDEERLLRCWKTARGFLLLTTLRCIQLWQRWELLRPGTWVASPELLLYNVRPPTVLLGRFVEIAPAFDEGNGPIRVAVSDPLSVAREISDAIEPGRRLWQARRAKAVHDLEARRKRREAIAAAVLSGQPIPVIKVPCAYCGNSIPATARHCPYCGAPTA